MSFTLDTREFGVLFEKGVKRFVACVSKGAFQTGAIILRDAIIEEPRAPHKTGNLWRHQKIVPIESKGIVGVIVGFNTDYAAKLHEWPRPATNWTLKGSGPKYLETKLVRHKAKYIKLMGEKTAGAFK